MQVQEHLQSAGRQLPAARLAVIGALRINLSIAFHSRLFVYLSVSSFSGVRWAVSAGSAVARDMQAGA